MTSKQQLTVIFYMVIAIVVFNFIEMIAFLDIIYEAYQKIAGVGLDVNIIEKTV